MARSGWIDRLTVDRGALHRHQQPRRPPQAGLSSSSHRYVQGHKCPRLFYLEVADYIVEQPESDEDEQTSDAGQDKPIISLSAIAGIRTEDTMQVYV